MTGVVMKIRQSVKHVYTINGRTMEIASKQKGTINIITNIKLYDHIQYVKQQQCNVFK